VNILATPGVNILERDVKRPTFSATLDTEAGKGGQVEIVIGGDSYTVMIDPADGSWSFTWPEDLDDGTYSLSIRVTDKAGNDGHPKLYNLMISTTPPEPPTLLNLNDNVGGKTGGFDVGTTTDDRRPALSGDAKPGSIVVLMRDGEEIGSAVADPVTGLWTLEPNVDLQDGENRLTLVTRDTFAKKDRESEESDPFTIVINADGADNGGIALITHGWDDSGENFGELSTGALTSDTTPQLFGSAPASSTVRVQYRGENGSWTDGGTAVAGPDGEWNWTAPVLGAGNWEFRSSAATSGGWSDEFVLEISGQAQAEVTITHGWDSEGAYTGELRSGALTDDNKPQLFGRAEANSLVYVHARLPGGEWERVGSAHAGPDGRWTLETERLSAGSNELTAGNSPAASGDALFDLEVVTADPAAPQIVGAYDDAGIITHYLGNPDVTDDRTPRLEGRAPTGAVVVIYQDGVPVGSTVAAGGLWQFEVPALTEDGTYSFTTAIRSGGTDGPQSPAWNIVLNTGEPADVTLEILSMTADSGASASDFLTNDGSAGRTLSGILSRELVQGERVLVSNGMQVLEAVVSGISWTLVDPDAHSGSWIYTAWVENAVTGRNSGEAQQTVTFDNSIVRATIDSIHDSVSNSDIDAGGTTADRTPTLSGRAEAGSLVIIYDGTAPLGSVKASDNGDWTWTVSPALSAKGYNFTVTAEDTAGNRSTPSSGWEVDITAAGNGSGTENWENASHTYLNKGISYSYASGLRVHVVKSVTNYNHGGSIGNAHNPNLPMLGETTLEMLSGAILEFRIPPTNAVSLSLLRWHISYDVVVQIGYYDTQGKYMYGEFINMADHEYTEFTVSKFISQDGRQIGKVIVESSFNLLVEKISWGEDVINSVDNVTSENETNANNEVDVNALMENKETDEENKGLIDLTGEENNQVTLNLNDLLTSGEKNLFIENGKTQLLITGDENDTVQLDDLLPDGTDSGDWIAQNGTVTVAGVEYQVFSHSGEEAEVLIQQGIKTELI